MNNFTRYMIQIGQWKQTDKGIVQSGPYLSREKIINGYKEWEKRQKK